MATPNNFRVKSGLNVGTTIAGGNTTITGFANVSTSVNSALLTVGTSFIANTSKVAIGTAVGLEANGGIGTAGQVLHSNGTSIYWAADDNAGGTVTSVATANGLSGGPITTTGTLGVTTGSTLTVNTAGIHVNSALAITSLALSGALSGVTTAAMGNTTITGFANVTGNVQISAINATSFGATLTSNTTTALLTIGNSSVTATMNSSTFSGTANNSTNLGGSSLATVQGQITGNAATAYTNAIAIAANGSNITSGTVAFARLPSLFVGTTTIQSTSAAQAVSGITTLAAGNTTITGFANVSTTLAVAGISTFSGNVVLGSVGLSANGGFGTAAHVLHSNGTAAYWAADDNTTYDLTAVANTAVNAGLLRLADVNNSNDTVTFTGTGASNVSSNATHIIINSTDNSATAYTNAIAIAANGSNITSGTVAFARLPSLFIGTTTIQSTSAAQAVSGITTLAAGNTTITGDITVSGNLTINGTTTNINSTNLLVEDKNIILGDVTTPTDVTADGGGITLKGATDKTLNWVDATDSWTASEHIDIAAGKVYKIGTTTIANSTALGTGILTSSLTSVGTLSSLTVGGISTFNGNVVLGSSGLSANGGFGTAAQILHSNGTATYWAADDGITSLVAANGLNGGTITSTGTMSVLGGSTLTVNSVGAHVNSALSITSLTLAGAASGITTLAAGNTTITGFANVTSTIQGGSSLTIAGAASGITTLAAGNTTITGFANVTTTMQVGGVTTLAANLVMANNNITRPILTGYTEHELAAAVSGSYSLDCGAANFWDLNLQGNITIAPTNVPPATRVWSGTIAAKQDATGGRTITWPAGTKYAGGVSPPATTTANAVDIWSIMTYDGGTTYIVSLSVKNAS